MDPTLSNNTTNQDQQPVRPIPNITPLQPPQAGQVAASNTEIVRQNSKKFSIKKILFFFVALIIIFLIIALAIFIYTKKVTKTKVTTQPKKVTENANNSATNLATFSAQGLTFKYPNSFDNLTTSLISASPAVQINFLSIDSASNIASCIKPISIKKVNNVYVWKLQKTKTPKNCANVDTDIMQYWIVKSPNELNNGLIFTYYANDAEVTDPIFNKIVSTFKFTNN